MWDSWEVGCWLLNNESEEFSMEKEKNHNLQIVQVGIAFTTWVGVVGGFWYEHSVED